MTTVREAVELIKQSWGLSTAQFCGVMDFSTSYLQRCLQSNDVSMATALKIEALTLGLVSWRDLKPELAQAVEATVRQAKIIAN